MRSYWQHEPRVQRTGERLFMQFPHVGLDTPALTSGLKISPGATTTRLQTFVYELQPYNIRPPGYNNSKGQDSYLIIVTRLSDSDSLLDGVCESSTVVAGCQTSRNLRLSNTQKGL